MIAIFDLLANLVVIQWNSWLNLCPRRSPQIETDWHWFLLRVLLLSAHRWSQPVFQLFFRCQRLHRMQCHSHRYRSFEVLFIAFPLVLHCIRLWSASTEWVPSRGYLSLTLRFIPTHIWLWMCATIATHVFRLQNRIWRKT